MTSTTLENDYDFDEIILRSWKNRFDRSQCTDDLLTSVSSPRKIVCDLRSICFSLDRWWKSAPIDLPIYRDGECLRVITRPFAGSRCTEVSASSTRRVWGIGIGKNDGDIHRFFVSLPRPRLTHSFSLSRCCRVSKDFCRVSRGTVVSDDLTTSSHRTHTPLSPAPPNPTLFHKTFRSSEAAAIGMQPTERERAVYTFSLSRIASLRKRFLSSV